MAQGEPLEPLTISLYPEEVTAGFPFRVTWDGDEVEMRREGGRFSVEIPPERLTEGRHSLRLRRGYPPGINFATIQHDNLFTQLSFTHGDRAAVLAPADGPRLRRIAEFVQHGVIGQSKERRGGLLGVGAGTHLLPIGAEAEPSQPVSLRFEPENFSQLPATFRLRTGEVEAMTRIEPGERGSLSVELPAGAREVALEVEGQTDGVFLWGAPILDRPAADLPPVILITLDTTRRDALSPYSGRAELTPAIEDLARRATVFDNAFATAPWTLPSHASIFTGLYPSRHGAGVTEPWLPPASVTLAELLRRRGYVAAGISAGDLSASRFGLAQGFHHYRDPDRFETPGVQVAEYVDEFLTLYGSRPLFLFVNYFDPHAIYQAPAELDELLGVPARAEKIRDLPVWGDLLKGGVGAWREAVEGRAPITPEVMDYLEAAYLAEIAHVDRLLGRFFDRLRDLGIFDRALIVVTADHGELLGEGGYVHHAARLDPELVEIPLIVKWPGQTEGTRVSDLVSQVDLFPTVLAAAGVEAPPSDGRPLSAPSAGPADGAEGHRFVLFEEHHALVHPLHEYMQVAQHLFGVQRPGFRQLVWDAGEECARLADGDWVAAPCTTEREQVLQSIKSQLRIGETAAPASPDAPMSDELRESLEALGYL